MVFLRTESVQQIIISPFWRTALFLRFIIPVADFIDNSGLFAATANVCKLVTDDNGISVTHFKTTDTKLATDN